MFDDSILDPIKQAVWEATRRDHKEVFRIHVTSDFYMKLKVTATPPVINLHKSFDYPILGYSVIEHFEPCDREWWLETYPAGP